MCGICVCPWYLDFIVSVATVRILNERLLSVRRGAKRERVVQEMSFGGMQEEMVGFCASLLALILGFYDRASGCYPHRVCYSLSLTHTQDCTFMQSHEHGHTELFHTLAQIHTGVYVYTAHIEVPQLVIHF